MSWAAVAAAGVGAGIGLLGSRSGGSNTTTQQQTFTPPEWLVPHWQNYVNSGMGLYNQPTPQYGGMSVAPWTPQQYQGSDMLTGIATAGTPTYNAGQSALVSAAGAPADPYSTQLNPYLGQANPYLGSNPYMDAVIAGSNRDITDAYSTGTAAQTDANAIRSGSFGGSAHDLRTQQNQRTLADALARNTSSLRYGDYTRSGDLAESGLNRNAQLGEGALNRASGAWQQGQGRALSAAGLAPQYQAADINAISAMMNAGAGQQGYQQSLLDSMRSFFNTSAQDPYNRLNMMGGLLGGASGNSMTSTSTAPGSNPWLNAAGGALAGYQMGRQFMPYLPQPYNSTNTLGTYGNIFGPSYGNNPYG